jgi:2'-hydroxyisoflavone reductase
MPGRALNVRSGLIVGPFDTTDRFTYWPVRIARGGEVIVPPPDAPLQVIDVRDLSAWIIDMVEQNKNGVYNATGPAGPLTFGAVTETANTIAGNTATLVDPGEHFLVDQHVAPWADLPLWLPEQIDGMAHVNISKAIAGGLTYRSIGDTIRDTLDWYQSTHEPDAELKAGISREREAELLAAWKAEQGEQG